MDHGFAASASSLRFRLCIKLRNKESCNSVRDQARGWNLRIPAPTRVRTRCRGLVAESRLVFKSAALFPAKTFAPSTLTPEQVAGCERGRAPRVRHVESFADKSHPVKPGWNTFIRNVGRYGTDYISRAITARLALGANPPEDAIYISTFTDREGQPLNGLARYLGKSRSDIREAYGPTAGFWFHGHLPLPMGIVLDIMVAQLIPKEQRACKLRRSKRSAS
jgi:hypothetical protein